MEEEFKRALEVEREKEKQRWEESVRYQEQLEEQLTEKEKRKQVAYEEFLKEKLMIDEIVRKIYEEDQRYVLFLLYIMYNLFEVAVVWLAQRNSLEMQNAHVFKF